MGIYESIYDSQAKAQAIISLTNVGTIACKQSKGSPRHCLITFSRKAVHDTVVLSSGQDITGSASTFTTNTTTPEHEKYACRHPPCGAGVAGDQRGSGCSSTTEVHQII
eukprot:jgi/Chrzof1/8010/UNPLg00061.t1